MGQDQAQAKTDAARNALNYLKMMAKKSCAAINKENNSNNINSINSNNSNAVNNLAADKAKTQTRVAAVNGTKG